MKVFNQITAFLFSILIFGSVMASAQTPSEQAPAPQASSSQASPEQLLNQLNTAEDLEGSALLNTRDPFNPPDIIAEAGIERSPLESVPLENMKLSGIIVGLNKHKAILITPDGKTHIIGVGTKIGVRKGFVKKITPNSILVRERFANVFGKEENIDTEIKLPEKRD